MLTLFFVPISVNSNSQEREELDWQKNDFGLIFETNKQPKTF